MFFITLKNAFAALLNMFNLTSTEMREGKLSFPPPPTPLHKDLLNLSFYQPSPTLTNLIKYPVRGTFTI